MRFYKQHNMKVLINCFFFALTLGLVSCGNKTSKKLTSDLIYFKGDAKQAATTPVPTYEPVIQEGDNLLIITNSLDRNTDQILNMPSTLGTSNMGGGATAGYLVGLDGYIQIPQIGNIKAAGLTKSQLQKLLLDKLKDIVKDPVVNIRILNYKINVLGEVSRPGQYPITNDKPTLIDAIGMAGDLTIFGRRDSVYIYREFNGKREIGVVNLNSIETFNSPFYYLRQNDVVYVMPNNRKMANMDMATQKNLTLTTSVVSTVALFATTIATIINFSK